MAEQNDYLVDGKYGIRDLVEMDRLHKIFEMFTQATGFTIGFLDHPGLNVLIATGWRDICTKHHRLCPIAAGNCLKSNKHLLDQLTEPGKLVVETCDNGLVDCATPIIIKGKHIASLATGQLLLKAPDIEHFRKQARAFGIEEGPYLEALKEIPVVSEPQLKSITGLLGEIAFIISELGYAKLEAREESLRLQEEIEERKRAEEEVKKLSAVVEQTTEGIAIAALDGTVIFSNNAWCRMHGYKNVQEIVGRNLAIFHDQEQMEKEVKPFNEKVIEQGSYSGEVGHITRDGQRIPTLMTAVLLKDKFGKPYAFAGIAKDITERKQSEETALEVAKAKGIAETMEKKMAEIQAAYRKLEEAQALLIQSEKMAALGVMSAGIAHEINNPLAAILSTARYYVEHKDSQDEEYSAFEEITQAGERMAKVVKGLLDYSKPSKGTKEELDCGKVIEFVINFSQKILIGNDVDVQKDFEKDLPLVKADKNQLEQVIIIIISNAIDAMQRKGVLKIATRGIMIQGNRFVEIEFIDSGCGIQKENLPKLFDPFFTTKRPGKGTGLGLSVANSIIKGYGGEILVESPPVRQERGASFKVRLPIVTGV